MPTLLQRKLRGNGTLSQRAYDAIRDGILKGSFAMGAVLSRRRLSAELGMSVLPVSEALQKLEIEGLVESRPRVGTMVRIPTPQDIRGNYVVREALECQSARLFAERATPEIIAKLRKMTEDLDARWANLDTSKSDARDLLLEIRKLHMRFHMEIAEVTGYPALVQAIERNQVLVSATFYDSLLSDNKEPPHWHEQLMDSLGSRNPDAAEAAMRIHVRNGLELLLERLEPYLRWDDAGLKLMTGGSHRRK